MSSPFQRSFSSKSPLNQERKSLNTGAVENIMKTRNVSQKEAIAIINKERSGAKSRGEKKVFDCVTKKKELKEVLAKDPNSEFGSILKQQIAENCK